MVPGKSARVHSLKRSLLAKRSNRVLISSGIPTPAQTEAVFNIVQRSILKNAKKRGIKMSTLQLKQEVHEMMSKWPKKNWPSVESRAKKN